MPRIMVINSGSSSLKCSLYSFAEQGSGGKAGPVQLCSGQVERIGEEKPWLTLSADGSETEQRCSASDHEAALTVFLDRMVDTVEAIESLDDIAAVGHRVVHGGESISRSVAVDQEVIDAIEENAKLAPLHNPPNLTGLRAAMERLPDCLQVAVFDTAFHQSMPPQAYLYALPHELYEDHDVRRYGFHGTSHRYVAERAAEMLERKLSRCSLITIHLGNGCSAAAVRNGESVDTSMGLTPLEGLVMGTRCGDMDPSLPLLFPEMLDMTTEEVYEMLNRRSGLKGPSGISNDMREIIAAARKEGERAERANKALEVFCYRVRKYIGAYAAVLGGVDAVVFTAGIGENCTEVRRRICGGLENLGIALDSTRNAEVRGEEAVISPPDSTVSVLVVPTDEELKIAMDTFDIYEEQS
ncbi:MAG: acetate/propionate family kinase [Planctomycetota bacterium]